MAKTQGETLETSGMRALFQQVRRVLGPELFQWRHRFALVLACRLSMSVSLFGPLILAHLIDQVLPQRNLRALAFWSALLLLVHVASYALWGWQARMSHEATEHVFLTLRKRLLHTVLHKPRNFFSHFSPGDLFTRLIHDVDFTASFFYHNLLRSISYFVFTLLTALFILVWHWKLGLVALLMLPALYFYADRMNRKLVRRSEESKQRLTHQNEILLDILSGHGEILFFRQQKSALERFASASSQLAESNVRANVCGEWVWGGLDALSQAMVLLPFLVGCYFAVQGEETVTAGLLTAYLAYLIQLASRAQFLFGGLGSFAQAVPSLRRMEELLHFPEEAEARYRSLEELPTDTSLSFNQVSFRYPDGPRILDAFSLKLLPGEKVAIMGPSGAGKSTLLGLLLRFQKPESGSIDFGGQDIDQLDPGFYYSFFGYVSQHTNLFELSIGENVALGWHGVPEDRIWQVLDMVRLKEWVQSLPHGLDTKLGQASHRLSGGQAQRIALARALVREPAILLLDEFTSGLDGDTEQSILKDLLELFKGQSIFCVTHSNRVASRFDRIIHLGGDHS